MYTINLIVDCMAAFSFSWIIIDIIYKLKKPYKPTLQEQIFLDLLYKVSTALVELETARKKLTDLQIELKEKQ